MVPCPCISLMLFWPVGRIIMCLYKRILEYICVILIMCIWDSYISPVDAIVYKPLLGSQYAHSCLIRIRVSRAKGSCLFPTIPANWVCIWIEKTSPKNVTQIYICNHPALQSENCGAVSGLG